MYGNNSDYVTNLSTGNTLNFSGINALAGNNGEDHFVLNVASFNGQLNGGTRFNGQFKGYLPIANQESDI